MTSMTSLSTLLPAATKVGNPAVNIAIFAVFVALTIVIVIRASHNNRTAADFYAGGRAFTGPQNGIAISGDYLSAASFLGIAGAIAINGYDGFLYSIGFLVAWLVALLLVAELLRNTGGSPWPMCSPSGSVNAPCVPRLPSRRCWSASSTC
jgi:Predicted symporter